MTNRMTDIIDAIFKRAKEGKAIFADREVLMPEYIPARLPFRDQQIETIAQVLAPVLHGSKPSNLLLYGKTGTGKTAVARYVVSRLKSESRDSSLWVAYVNTRIAGTEYRSLAELAQLIGVKVPSTGLSIGEVVDRILERIREAKSKVIFVVDEIDHLVKSYGDDILYQFTRAGDKITPAFLSIIGVSNDLEFKGDLDPRVLSSLGEEELVFPPYSVDELRQILHDRAKAALKSGAFAESAVNLCAAMAGTEHGDARRAVDLLRIAAEVAEREGLRAVDDECVKRASDKIEHDRVEEALRSLPLQNKIILLAVSRFESGANTGEVYLSYSSLSKRMGTELLTQRRLSGILAELALYGLLEAPVVSKGRRGRTKRIRLLVNQDTLSKTLAEDPAFASVA